MAYPANGSRHVHEAEAAHRARRCRSLAALAQPIPDVAVGRIERLPAIASRHVDARPVDVWLMGLLTTRMVSRLRQQSLLDPLTGLPNRRAFDTALGQERERVLRGGPRFAVLALDLGHFKRVNDTWGHAAGDAVLEQTAKRLLATVRKMDTVARTGGEEFVVLAPATSHEAALALAERIRTSVCAQPFELAEGPLEVTVSVGVATCLPDEAEPRQMMKRADVALYQAKQAGRNRVWAARGRGMLPSGRRLAASCRQPAAVISAADGAGIAPG